MTVAKSELPTLAGSSLQDAQAWFTQLRPHSSGAVLPGWHADDGFEGAPGFSEEAIGAINATVTIIFEYARDWPDADVVYRLTAGEIVRAETLWPGFVADIETSAGRIGYVSIPGRDKPNFVIEDFGGEFYLLEFEGAQAISQCSAFTMTPLSGVDFVADRSPVEYVDVSRARFIGDMTVEFSEIAKVDEVLQSLHDSMSPAGPKH